MSHLLDILYASLCCLASPWLLYRRLVLGKSIAGFREKLTGVVSRRNPSLPCIWLHAVSVGEVLQIKRLVAELSARHAGFEIVISTTTVTGYQVAQTQYPEYQVIYWPFDFSWSVDRALCRLQPALVVLVELEIWPNFLLAARRRQIPVVIANGRLSPRSFRGYSRWSRVMAPLWSSLTHIGAQTEEYRERFLALGVPAEKVTVTGNLKYDRIESDRHNPRTSSLRDWSGLKPDELVWIVGSTQDPEEQIALKVYEELTGEYPALRLILVPRHKERFEEVARLVTSRGHELRRRSQSGDPAHPRAVLLLDTLGELSACWGLADIAFVGGSLTKRGGQNMLEPAGYGAAVLFGPHTVNFRDAVEALLLREAADVVTDQASMCAAVRRLLANADERHRLGAAAKNFVCTQQGATARTLEILGRQLGPRAQRRAA